MKLRDWLILLVLAGVALALIVPLRQWQLRRANVIRCASNLRALGQAILLYSNENRGAYPRTTYVGGATVIPTWGTGAAAQDPFKPDGPAPNDVSAAIFLLLRTQEVTPDLLVCPASNATKWDFGGGANTALNWSNWQGSDGIRRHLSYSYQNPYPDEGYWPPWYNKRWLGSGPLIAVMADMNPGATDGSILGVTPQSSTDQLRRGNSLNHMRDGQNVLYFDGHVGFQTSPLSSYEKDNIYTRRAGWQSVQSGSVINAPYDFNDSVLLPTDH